jgi:endonuclease YncB( thermonuclease family)
MLCFRSLLIVSSLLLCAAHANTLNGRVVGVADGDTITVLDANREQHKIRLGGIDAPEKAQPFGQRSKQSLSTLVFGKDVEVRWNKRDRYQRIVGKVMVADPNCWTSHCPKTLDPGLGQLTVGLAWWYAKYAKEQSPEDAGRYEFAEREARAKRVGLWADGQPIPPWDWRKGER